MSDATFFGGTVASGWESVQEAFIGNFSGGEEVGAGVSVYHRGQQVVDLWGGSFDAAGSQPYDDQALQLVFSTTKGITAIAVAMCVQRGLLDYGKTVASYWPEFAAHGKQDATVAQLLSHRCGLFSIQGSMTFEEVLDWDTITSRLADTKPEWPIGTAHGYHAVTYGWLAGELVRRVDPQHRSLGTFVREEIAEPLGADLWIGLPTTHHGRVSPILGGLAMKSDDPAMQAMLDQFMGPESNVIRALTLNGALAGDGIFNRAELLSAEIPAANAVTNARSLARVYAATFAPVDGVQLLDDDVRNVARTDVTPAGEVDMCLMMPTTFGMGFMVNGMFTPYAGPGSYGHPGAGGSVAFAQPERELGFAYVMNQMAANLAGDLRAQRLIDASTKVIDSL